MLVAFSLVSAAAAEPVSAPSQEPEITVIARKLKGWRGHALKKKGVWVCKTKQSTGDAEIDKIGCDSMVTCFAELEPELQSIFDNNSDKKRRQQLQSAFFKDRMTPCVQARRSDGIAALADRRAGQ